MSGFLPIGSAMKPLTDERPVGVWVSQKDAKHVGLAFRVHGDEGIEEHVIHLIKQHKLLDQTLDLGSSKKQYLISLAGIESTVENGDAATNFANFLSNVGRLCKSNLPYGIDWVGTKDAFRLSGEFQPWKGSFTCATFISALFQSFGLPVVDVDEWISEDADENWLSEIILNHQKNNDLEEEERENLIAAVRSDRAMLRLKPAQIASTSALDGDSWPVTQSEATAHGENLKMAFNEAFPPVKPN